MAVSLMVLISPEVVIAAAVEAMAVVAKMIKDEVVVAAMVELAWVETISLVVVAEVVLAVTMARGIAIGLSWRWRPLTLPLHQP